MNHPVEPAAIYRHLAATLRQMFVALIRAGFSEKQALTILGQLLYSSTMNNEGDDDTGKS